MWRCSQLTNRWWWITSPSLRRWRVIWCYQLCTCRGWSPVEHVQLRPGYDQDQLTGSSSSCFLWSSFLPVNSPPAAVCVTSNWIQIWWIMFAQWKQLTAVLSHGLSLRLIQKTTKTGKRVQSQTEPLVDLLSEQRESFNVQDNEEHRCGNRPLLVNTLHNWRPIKFNPQTQTKENKHRKKYQLNMRRCSCTYFCLRSKVSKSSHRTKSNMMAMGFSWSRSQSTSLSVCAVCVWVCFSSCAPPW